MATIPISSFGFQLPFENQSTNYVPPIKNAEKYITIRVDENQFIVPHVGIQYYNANGKEMIEVTFYTQNVREIDLAKIYNILNKFGLYHSGLIINFITSKLAVQTLYVDENKILRVSNFDNFAPNTAAQSSDSLFTRQPETLFGKPSESLFSKSPESLFSKPPGISADTDEVVSAAAIKSNQLKWRRSSSSDTDARSIGVIGENISTFVSLSENEIRTEVSRLDKYVREHQNHAPLGLFEKPSTASSHVYKINRKLHNYVISVLALNRNTKESDIDRIINAYRVFYNQSNKKL